ncbi:MAG: Fe-S cluster assembly protein SufD, partial [Cyanobacteriota bacterium]
MPASLAAPAAAKGAWLDAWLATAPAASGELALVQQRGREALRQRPMPSGRDEDWRFTDLSLLQTLPLTAASAAAAALPEVSSGALRVNWNGSADPLADQALPAGLQRLSADEIAQGLGHTLAAAGCEQHWPVELNHAAAERVLALRVSSRSQVSLELVSAAAEGLQALRLLLLLEEKAELDLSQLIELAFRPLELHEAVGVSNPLTIHHLQTPEGGVGGAIHLHRMGLKPCQPPTGADAGELHLAFGFLLDRQMGQERRIGLPQGHQAVAELGSPSQMGLNHQ